MGEGAGLYMYDVVVKSSRPLSHLLVSSCKTWLLYAHTSLAMISRQYRILASPCL